VAQHHFEHGAARSLASLGTEIGIGIPEDSSVRSRFLDRYRFFLFLHHASVSLLAQIEFLRSRPTAREFLDYHCVRSLPKYDISTRLERDIYYGNGKKKGPYSYFLIFILSC